MILLSILKLVSKKGTKPGKKTYQFVMKENEILPICKDKQKTNNNKENKSLNEKKLN